MVYFLTIKFLQTTLSKLPRVPQDTSPKLTQTKCEKILSGYRKTAEIPLSSVLPVQPFEKTPTYTQLPQWG